MQVANEVPADRAAVKARSGYLTGWSLNAYYLCLPAGASSPRLSSPTDGFSVVPFNGSTWVDDGYGHRLARIIGRLAPDAHGEIELSYDLPPGTFTGRDGAVRYGEGIRQTMPLTFEAMALADGSERDAQIARLAAMVRGVSEQHHIPHIVERGLVSIAVQA